VAGPLPAEEEREKGRNAKGASALFAQLQRASLSVELNIAEGYSFGPSRTYTRHFGVAYGSAVEGGDP